MYIRLLAVAIVLGGIWSTDVSADTLLLDQVVSQNQTTGPRPSRGMSMKGVEEKFGQPAVKHDAVGDPPIARWEYQNFIVYFEYQTVIHAVEKHTSSS
jgi:hypothetical protein